MLNKQQFFVKLLLNLLCFVVAGSVLFVRTMRKEFAQTFQQVCLRTLLEQAVSGDEMWVFQYGPQTTQHSLPYWNGPEF
jgi:hypothetical protein